MITNTPQTNPPLFPIAFEIQTDLALRPDYEGILIKSKPSYNEPVLVSLHKAPIGNAEEMETIIHLVEMNGIKITVTDAWGFHRLKKIEVRVDVLLGGLNDYQPSNEDMNAVDDVVKNLISPILLYPEQSNLIMPKFRHEGKKIKFSSLNMIEIRVHLNSVQVSRLRGLEHPNAKGQSSSETKGCIQLGRGENGWMLRFEDSTEGGSMSHKMKCLQPPLCVTLTLSGDYLSSILRHSGFSKFHSLLGAERIDLARIVKTQMSKLKGHLLPVPQGDANEDVIVKFARFIALETKGNPLAREALLSNAEEVFTNLSGGVTDRSFDEYTALKKFVRTEVSRIKPIKISSLFSIESITTPVKPWNFYLDVPVHPLIRTAKGGDYEDASSGWEDVF